MLLPLLLLRVGRRLLLALRLLVLLLVGWRMLLLLLLLRVGRRMLLLLVLLLQIGWRMPLTLLLRVRRCMPLPLQLRVRRRIPLLLLLLWVGHTLPLLLLLVLLIRLCSALLPHLVALLAGWWALAGLLPWRTGRRASRREQRAQATVGSWLPRSLAVTYQPRACMRQLPYLIVVRLWWWLLDLLLPWRLHLHLLLPWLWLLLLLPWWPLLHLLPVNPSIEVIIVIPAHCTPPPSGG